MKGCEYFRNYKVEYLYSGDEHKKIYYNIYQCLKKDQTTVTKERAKFSYSENGELSELPLGCPPPIIPVPETPNPCKNSYKVGKVVATTVASILVPKLLEDDDSNPFNTDPAYKDILGLKEEWNT